MKCPNCGLINPDTAMRCDCGYNFETTAIDAEKALAKKSVKYKKLALAFFVIGTLPSISHLLSGSSVIINWLTNPVNWIGAMLWGASLRHAKEERGTQSHTLEQDSPSVSGFLSMFFIKYSEFLKTYVAMRKPPFLFLTVWLLGMASAIDRIEMKYLTLGEYQVDNWLEAWTLTVVSGLIAGYLAYWIGGAWYHLRVWLSGGSGERYLSSNLFLYTGIPLYLFTLLSQITDTFVYGNDYFTQPTSVFLDTVWFVLAVVGIIYSISLSYKGVRLLHTSAVFRTRLFFIVLPGIFYVAFLGGATFTLLEDWSEGWDYNEQAVEKMSEGDYDEAERLFKLALEKMTKDDTEDSKTIHENLGQVYALKGDNDEAIQHYEEALSLSELDSPDYYSTSGEIKILGNSVAEAIKDFEKALELDPDHFSANNNLGLIFLGMIDESIEDFERALPHNQKAYLLGGDLTTMENLALSYYALDRFADALPLFETLNTASPDNGLAKYYIGFIYLENGDLTKARIFLREAIRLDPSLNSAVVQEILGLDTGDQPDPVRDIVILQPYPSSPTGSFHLSS